MYNQIIIMICFFAENDLLQIKPAVTKNAKKGKIWN